MSMGHDDMQRKTTRYHAHAHDPLARTWADDFNRLALGSQYEKTAAPFSKRRNSSYQPVDRSPGGFYGLHGTGDNAVKYGFIAGFIATVWWLSRKK